MKICNKCGGSRLGAKYILDYIRNIDINIKIKCEQIQHLDKKDRMYSRKKRKIKKQISKLKRSKEKITSLIDLVPSPECKHLLYARYVFNKSWLQIQKDMMYSDSGCYKIHKKAIEELDDIMQHGKKKEYEQLRLF